MNRRGAVLALVALGAARVPSTSLAQQKDRVWRVGVVWGSSKLVARPYEEAFLAGMKDHGYDLARNLIVDSRYAEGKPTRYPALVDEVIALKPDVLIGVVTGAAIAMKSRTTTIPIVTGATGDPVASGLAQSLARPGGNVTGMSVQLDELSVKHIEMMAEVLPRMRRVALLIDMSVQKPNRERYEHLANTTAEAKGLTLQLHRVDNLEQIRDAFRLLETQRADALLIAPSPLLNNFRQEIGKSAANIRLPSIGFGDEYAQDGGLMSYGPSLVESLRRAAYFADRILKGAKPSDLPIEQPTRFHLVINAKTARALDVKIPNAVLVRADRVIE